MHNQQIDFSFACNFSVSPCSLSYSPYHTPLAARQLSNWLWLSATLTAHVPMNIHIYLHGNKFWISAINSV